MMKRETPKRVTLPNGRTFVARYECVTCNHLPANILLRRPYKQRAAPCGSLPKRMPKHQLCENLVMNYQICIIKVVI